MAAKNDKKSSEVATVGAAQLPDGFSDSQEGYRDYDGPKGNEQFDSNDVAVPRLKLCQSMTPEVKEGKAKEGDVMHTITGEIVADLNTPLFVIPVVATKNYILWRDRKNGGGVMARAEFEPYMGAGRFRWDKPNQDFEDKIDGKTPVKYHTKNYIDEDGLDQWGTQLPGVPDSPPAATLHYNYVVVLPDRNYEMVLMSFARTQINPGKQLNSLLGFGNAPIFARRFKMETFIDTKGENDFANWRVSNAGVMLPTNPKFEELKDLHEHMKSKNLIIDDEAGVDEAGEASDGKF